MAGALTLELETQARMSWSALGLILAVTYELAFVVTPPVVNSTAVTAAAAVPGTRASEQAKVTVQTKALRSAAVLGLLLVGLIPPPTLTSTLLLRRVRLHISRSSTVRGASMDRAIA